MGSLIINTNEENKIKILKYLDDRSIEWEIDAELEQDELNKEGV